MEHEIKFIRPKCILMASIMNVLNQDSHLVTSLLIDKAIDFYSKPHAFKYIAWFCFDQFYKTAITSYLYVKQIDFDANFISNNPE